MSDHVGALMIDVCSGVAASAHGQPVDCVIDPAHSRITFAVPKWGLVDVEGQVSAIRGTIRWDPTEPAAATTSWQAQVNSIRTGEPKRDASLRDPEYFDVARFPIASFSSVRAILLDGQRLSVEGQLTLRGVTRPVTVVVTRLGVIDVAFEGRLAVFETTFAINRREFGIVGGSFARTSDLERSEDPRASRGEAGARVTLAASLGDGEGVPRFIEDAFRAIRRAPRSRRRVCAIPVWRLPRRTARRVLVPGARVLPSCGAYASEASAQYFVLTKQFHRRSIARTWLCHIAMCGACRSPIPRSISPVIRAM